MNLIKTIIKLTISVQMTITIAFAGGIGSSGNDTKVKTVPVSIDLSTNKEKVKALVFSCSIDMLENVLLQKFGCNPSEENRETKYWFMGAVDNEKNDTTDEKFYRSMQVSARAHCKNNLELQASMSPAWIHGATVYLDNQLSFKKTADEILFPNPKKVFTVDGLDSVLSSRQIFVKNQNGRVSFELPPKQVFPTLMSESILHKHTVGTEMDELNQVITTLKTDSSSPLYNLRLYTTSTPTNSQLLENKECLEKDPSSPACRLYVNTTDYVQCLYQGLSALSAQKE